MRYHYETRKRRSADLVIQVFWAIAGLFILMILAGAVGAIVNSMNSENRLTPVDKQLESPLINSSNHGFKQ
jgi:hypothetical protein